MEGGPFFGFTVGGGEGEGEGEAEMGGVCGGEDGEGGLPAGGADDDVGGDGGAGGENESGWGEGGDVLAVDVYVVGNRVPEVGALVYACAVVLPEYAAECERGVPGRWGGCGEECSSAGLQDEFANGGQGKVFARSERTLGQELFITRITYGVSGANFSKPLTRPSGRP